MTQAPSYQLTPDAQADLIGIRRFTLEKWGNAQSITYLSKLRQTFALLDNGPGLGTLKPELGRNIVCFPCASHVTYYVLDERNLIIFAVLHKSLVPDSHLEHRKLP